MRTIKTALAVGICLEVFSLLNIGSNINGVQASLAATICMKSSLHQTLKTGLDRARGTFIGAVFGIVFLLLENAVPRELFAVIATAGVVAVIYLCNIFGLQASVSISVVVYVVILATERTISPVVYGAARLGETVFGIFVAYTVNRFIGVNYVKKQLKPRGEQGDTEPFVRRFENRDLGRVMQAWLSGNIRAHGSIDEMYWHEQYDSARETIKTASTLVFDFHGDALGFISVINDTEIYGIYVSEAFQGGGIGTQLLRACQNAYPCLTLRVYKENERAVKFFLNRGFSISKESTNEKTGRPEYTLGWSTKSTICSIHTAKE
jgi:putative acetyltransferase